MKNVLLPLLPAVALLLSACPSSSLNSAASTANQKMESQGLPFRYSVQGSGSDERLVIRMLPLPAGETKADAHLAQEVMTAIRQREQGKGRASVELQEVRQMPDGREVWVLQSIGEGVAYVVSLGSSAGAVRNVGLLGPYNYSN
jgi:hypothetical protein